MADRVSQLTLEVGILGGSIRALQFVLQVLVPYVEATPVATYPVLPGLGFNVIKKPVFSTGKGISASGRQVRVGYFACNLWKWELKYDYLPDFSGTGGLTASDYKTLQSFFIGSNGGLLPFQFEDPDDNAVVNGLLGTANGVATDFVIGRYYNSDTDNPFEPVGMVNLSETATVMLNGAVQNPADYDIVTTTPGYQVLHFHAAPSAAVVVTMSFSFYFWATFEDDTIDFEKFLNLLWSAQSILLNSQRG